MSLINRNALLIVFSIIIVSSIILGFLLNNKLPTPPNVNTQIRIENPQYPPEPVTVIATTVEASSVGKSQKSLGFHASFFNSYMSEWGILNRYDEPVKVTVTFSRPTKIQSISNIFTGCEIPDCYVWRAEGIIKDKTVTLVERAIATSFNPSEETVTSQETFEKAILTAERVKGDKKIGVEWKKMSFKYK